MTKKGRLKIKIKNYFTASRVFRALKKKKTEKDIIVWFGSCLGEIVFGMAYLKYFKQEHGDRNVILIACKKNVELIETYDGVSYDTLVLLPEDKENEYSKSLACCWHNKHTYKKCMREGIYSTLPSWWWHKEFPYPNILAAIRNDVFKIKSPSAGIMYHNFTPRKVTAIENFYNICDRVVIVNQYSNSTFLSDAATEHMEKSVNFLKERGYIVYSNLVGDQVPLKGTLPLKVDLHELLEIASHIRILISARSGLLDFLAKTNVNMFVYYAGFPIKQYTLDQWGGGA